MTSNPSVLRGWVELMDDSLDSTDAFNSLHTFQFQNPKIKRQLNAFSKVRVVFIMAFIQNNNA